MDDSASTPLSASSGSLSADANLRDLLVFHNVARALASSLDRDDILRTIMQQMEQFFKPETWSLLLVDEGRHDLYYAVAVGHAEAELHNLRVPFGQGLAGWVAEHGESLIVPEVSEDPRFADHAAKDASVFRIHSAICMPLRSRLRTLGVIQLFNSPLDTLTDYTISFLHVLCDYAAIAIDNARAVERIQELTITDDVTGLYNTRHLYNVLKNQIEGKNPLQPRNPTEATSAIFSLIFIDLDYFKRVNDEYGHLIGSHLLYQVGQMLRSLIRKQDVVFRYGGDEFIVLLPGTGKQAGREIAVRLMEELRRRRFSTELNLQIRASFGLATYPEDGTSVHEIIRAADTAMYTVKGTTKDNFAVAGEGIIPEIKPF